MDIFFFFLMLQQNSTHGVSFRVGAVCGVGVPISELHIVFCIKIHWSDLRSGYEITKSIWKTLNH